MTKRNEVQRVPRQAARARDVVFVLLVWAAGWTAPCRAIAQQTVEAFPQALEAARAIEKARAAVIADASSATISVFDVEGNGGGSGVVISPDGFALTNYHVVKPCGVYMHCSLPDGKLYDAVLVGLDPTGDVAMIKLLGREDFPMATIGDSDRVRVGEHCFAIGNPFLLATDFQPTVTWGIVSGVNRYQYPAGTLLEYADCIQTDAAINPGNSGGPLFNARGELIGINGRGSFEKRGRVNVGVGYAISINQIKLFLEQLSSGRIVDHASLGATVAADSRGVIRVDNILQSSDAWRRGLRYDDEIVSFGGRSIETVNEFKNVLGIFPKDWRVPLVYRRDDREYSVVVRLAGLHSTEELVEQVQGPPKPAAPDAKPPVTPEDKAADSTSIPEEVSKLIERKRGFANFHFNRAQSNALWSRAIANGDPTILSERWTIAGRLPNGTSIKFVFSPRGGGMQWGDQTFVLDAEDDLGQQLHPAETGGLLPALYMWQRLLSLGPDQYGDVIYFGDLPYGPELTRQFVLAGTFDVAETNFFLDKLSGRLIGLEFWTDRSRDPCEITFEDFRAEHDIELPYRLAIRYGDDGPWIIQIDSYEFSDDN